MNSDIVVGKWKQWKSQMWLLWAEWFDSDCAWVAGSNDYLSGVLQEDYGKSMKPESSHPNKSCVSVVGTTPVFTIAEPPCFCS